MNKMDLSEAKKRILAAGQNIKERDYWLEKLSGQLVKTTFPYDYRKAEEKRMVSLSFQLTGPVYASLLRISNKSDVRLHIILVAGWLMLLHRYTGADDIIVGIPTYRQEVEGRLINTVLALRNTVTGEMTVKEMLLQVGQAVLKANENQNYPIETLIYKLNLPDSGGDFPLFDISILLEELHDKDYLAEIRQNLVVSFRQSGESFTGVMEYNANLYRESTIQRIVGHFCQLLENALMDVNVPVSRLEMLSEQERKQILTDFNGSTADFPRDKSIYRFVEDHARQTPDAPALGFDNEVDLRTYDRLNRNANRLARVLTTSGVRPQTDRTVGILMERGPAMVECILAIWKAGAAYIPLDTGYPLQRVLGILKDSETAVLFADPGALDPQVYTKLKESYAGIMVDVNPTGPFFDKREGEGSKEEPDSANLDLDVPMDSLAYVIYTSGSTGKPKGAMVEHIGMMNHIQAKIDLLGITPGSVVAQNASQTFDISVWQFFVALTRGGKTVIYSEELIMDPVKFIHRLVEDRVTVLEAVPSYLSVLLDASAAQGADPLPMPMEYLVVTGEEIKPHLVARWFEMYPGIPMINAYGPTEASDDITHHVMTGAPAVERIPIGKPVPNLNIYIVDPYGKLCPVGMAGEIWVSGVGVGRGYLKDEERTARAFMDDPFAPGPGIRLYKTGDLGRWLPDGSIEFLGRIDYQVKIRGFRIELGEIENCLARHSLVREAVVLDREDAQGNKYLCAYITAARTLKAPEIETLKEYLNQVLPDYMVPAHFVVLEMFPLTNNGKIDRKALPEPEMRTGDIPYIPEETLNRWKEEFAAAGSQGPAAVEKAVKKSRRRIDAAEEVLEMYKKLEKYPRPRGRTYYPLTHTQKMFYYNEKYFAGAAIGIVALSVKYPEILDQRLLEQAFNKVLMRNPALRLRIVELDLGSSIQPAQYMAQYQPYVIDSFDFSAISGAGSDANGRVQHQSGQDFEAWGREDMEKKFQLLDSDLFYLAYIKFNAQESGYYLKMHHMVADTYAFHLVFKEIHRTYRQLQAGASPAEEPNPSFIQHLLEERDYLTSPQFEKDREYWHKTLLPLPAEAEISPRSGKDVNPFNVKIESRVMVVPSVLRTRIHEFCGRYHSSLFGIFLAALSIYVFRFTRLEDFVIASVNHGRASDLQRKIAGLLIDFFLVRITIDPHMEFREFVEKNTRGVRDILKNHGRYPYDILLSELKEMTGVDTGYLNNINIVGHSPMEVEYAARFHHPGYSSSPIGVNVDMSNKDRDGILELGWEYQVERFSADDIAGIHRSLLAILGDALENPGKPISEIDILSEEDKHLILHTFNDTAAVFPADKTLYQLFEEQVNRTPGNIAARDIFNPEPLTYEELNRKANQLARRLRARGVTANSIVGIFIKRSLEMIIGMLAVMKAGGATMAFGLGYPDKRIEYMCSDAGAAVILTDNTRELPESIALMIDVGDNSNYEGDGANLPLVNTSRDPAAVFYTSGSTGKPKGVIVEHRGLVNRLWWLLQLYPLEESDVILQKTPVFFDVSMWELFSWSFRGASIYFMDPARGEKARDLVDAVIEGNVTHIHIPPASQLDFANLIESDEKLKEITRLKLVIASGEALLPVHVNTFNRVFYRGSGTRLLDLYGPTEASIEVSCFDCSSDREVDKVPIGKPIQNIRLLIVDENFKLVPVGMIGQLCIAGVGLARGYLNQPELTNERFVDYRSYRTYRTYFPERIYQTGDLARWLPDGNIEFLGRMDNQVQIGGIRVELAEIESFLLNHKDIKEAAVVAWQEGKNEYLSLCAFLVAADDLSRSDFKKHLVNELPQFMIPGRFIELDRMPMTASGKIDRKILETFIPAARPGIKNALDELINRANRGSEIPSPGRAAVETEIAWGEENIPLSEEERQKILVTFNDTDMDFPGDKTIYQLFEEQAARTPGCTAVIGCKHTGSGKEEKKGEQVRLTYRDLNEKSNQLARVLRARGVTVNTIVGIMTERTIEMMVGIMAILKAGGAYLAISITDPDKRIEFVCRDSLMPMILTDNVRPLPDNTVPPLDITSADLFQGDAGNLPGINTSRDAAGVFYTSGSTGTPKGVVVEHQGMVNRMHWMHRRYPIDESDVILQKTAVIFDVSVWELFWWSFYGASVYLLPPGQGDNPQDIADAVRTGSITQMHFIPTPMAVFLDHVEKTGQAKELASLRRVFASGEALPPALVNHFNRLLHRSNGTRLYNLYGPTEASIDVSYFDCPADTDQEKIPIGKPIDNIRLYILGRNLELMPVGAVGELCIAGVGLARGYLNRPELTAERFVEYRSYRTYRTYFSEKIYRTGDLARWLPDGNIEFLGRIDHQVQINGIRIELGEIESALLKHKDIKEAVVIPKSGENDEPYLCAFFASGRRLGQADFRQALVRELPHYMVPAQFIQLEKLPLTPTGKVNRKLLEFIKVETETGMDRQVEYAPPTTELETQIAAVWKEVLNTDKIGIHDNFFDLGGNSLGIIQVNIKLKSALKRDIPALIMFEYPTIASMVQYLEKILDIDAGHEISPAEDRSQNRTEVKDRGKSKMQQRRAKIRKDRD
jgi:amino acid adenylation domain-containing protein